MSDPTTQAGTPAPAARTQPRAGMASAASACSATARRRGSTSWPGDAPTGRGQPRPGRVRRLRRNPVAIVGAVIVGLFVLVAIFAPLIAPHDPVQRFDELTKNLTVDSHPGRRGGIPARLRPARPGLAVPA